LLKVSWYLFLVLGLAYVAKIAFHQETPVNFAQSVEDFKVKGVPDFRLPLYDFTRGVFSEEVFRLRDLRAKVVLINFWATWCVPCLTEFPSLVELSQKYKDDPRLQIIAITMDQSPTEVKNFLARGPRPAENFTILSDNSYFVAHRYGTKKIPETYIIDGSHKLIRKIIDSQNWMGTEFLSFLDQLLGGKS
jgi:cytochrome c biogenesis protein CcmG, thiol:disulfide interchange protein DsbE